MVIVESSTFTKRVKSILSDEQYSKLLEALVARPEMGRLIQGAGGLRKLRWKREPIGKRGGVRVIYHWAANRDQILMLYLYQKNKQEELTPEQAKSLKGIVARWLDER